MPGSWEDMCECNHIYRDHNLNWQVGCCYQEYGCKCQRFKLNNFAWMERYIKSITIIALLFSFGGCMPKPYVVKGGTYHPRMAYNVLKDEFHFKARLEEARVVVFDKDLNVVGSYLTNVGTRVKVHVDLAKTFETAKQMGGTYVVLAHNHPDMFGMWKGLDPSDADIKCARRAVEVGKEYGIEVLDSLVVTDDDYLSLRELGWVFK